MQFDHEQSLAGMLESAVIVSWADLICGALAGLIHIEYGFAPAGTMDYLKIWASITRGHWLLVCEYRISPSTFHATGAHFENGYRSERLAHTLEFVMQNQSLFTPASNLGRQGLLQISTPTQEESAAATAFVKKAFEHCGSAVLQRAVA